MSYPHYSNDCYEYHDVVCDFRTSGERPRITVLCGSTRFGHSFREHNLRLTIAGHIVLSIGCDLRSDHELWRDLDQPAIERLKASLDELHKRKIDLADEVLVLNVGGYIGDSTRSEIGYAEALGKPVIYLESPDSLRPVGLRICGWANVVSSVGAQRVWRHSAECERATEPLCGSQS
jgi:hypothetical protein